MADHDGVLHELARGSKPLWRSGDYGATCLHGTVRSGHGIEVKIRTSKRASASLAAGRQRGTLTAHGSELFRAFPAGTGSLARMLLPLKVTFEVRHLSGGETVSLVLGAKQLSRDTLLRVLDGIVVSGDKPFVIELRRTSATSDELLCMIPTKASLILQSLAQGDRDKEAPSCMFRGDISNVKPPGFLLQCVAAVYSWLRWFALAGLLCAVCWQLLLAPDLLLRRAPALWPSQAQRNATKVRDVIFALPSKPSAAFELGVLHERLLRIETDSQQMRARFWAGGTSEILGNASRIVGQPVSSHQLHALLALLVEAEQQRGGAWQRMVGAITFVNTLWLFSILGIGVSVGPSCYHLVRPLHEMLARAMKHMYHRVLLPFARRLHTWCILEVAVWSFCVLLTVDGARVRFLSGGHRHDTDSGALIALTGTLLSVSALGYSTLLHGRKADHDLLAHIVFGWLAACWVPLAVHFQSRMLAEFAVLAVFCALGVYPVPPKPQP